MKICTKCEIYGGRNQSGFYKNVNSDDGHQGICKDCHREYRTGVYEKKLLDYASHDPCEKCSSSLICKEQKLVCKDLREFFHLGHFSESNIERRPTRKLYNTQFTDKR